MTSNNGGPAWEDATSYSQGERGRVAPTAWRSRFANVSVWISCSHRYYPESWVVGCSILGVDATKIAPKDATKEQAQQLALAYVGNRLNAKAKSLSVAADAMLAAREATE